MKKLGLIVAAAAMIATVSATVVSAKGWVQQGADWYYVDGSGEYVTDTIQSSGTSKFYLGEDGRMMKDYFLEDKDSQAYYFGSNGAMVTNTWVAIDSSIVENQGDYVPDTYWYYFQSSGKAMKAAAGSIKKTTIDGKKVAFNEYGQMLTGWITSDGKVVNPDDETNPFKQALYYAGGDNDGVLRTGWVTYYDGYDEGDDWLNDKTNLYFYFNPTNNKKTGNEDDKAVTKKINGKTYAFTNEGIMISAWDAVEQGDSDVAESLRDKVTYFSGEDDGHQVKKGWVYAVPSGKIDTDAYGDGEEKYMYFGSNGEVVRNQFKKINGKYYAFNLNGIMKTGLVVWCPDGYGDIGTDTGTVSNAQFVVTADLDYADGSDVSKKGYIRTGDTNEKYIKLNIDGVIIEKGAKDSGKAPIDTTKVKLHYFGDDGARKTGSNNVQFADDVYTFQSTASGDKGSGVFSKKYYSFGILLKASQDIRYGIFNVSTQSENDGDALRAQGQKTGSLWTFEYANNLVGNKYFVLTTSGSKQKGNKTAKKDADGNYWMIDPAEGTLKGIYTVNVKIQSDKVFTTKEYSDWAKIADQPTDKDSTAATLNSDLYIASAAESSTFGSGWACYETAKDSGKYVGAKKFEGDWYWFCTDYGDKSNQWLPCGLLDNANKTVCYPGKFTECTEDAAHRYDVTPNNDYFLNCYWTD